MWSFLAGRSSTHLHSWTSHESDAPAHLPLRAVDRIPTELLDRIIAYAVEYTQGSSHDPFQIHDKDLVDATRRNMLLVCKAWKMLAEQHVLRDIQFGVRCSWDPSTVRDYYSPDAHDAFHALFTYSIKQPSVLSGLRALAVYADPQARTGFVVSQRKPRLKRSASECMRATTAELAIVLSHTRRLKMFAATSDHHLLGLKMLAQPGCAQASLTHLDIDVDQAPCSPLVHCLNAFYNLEWLRIGNKGSYSPELLKGDEGADPESLPQLSLPKLQELEVIAHLDLDNETPMTFHLAHNALLPSLVRLRIHGPYQVDEDGIPEVACFESTLRHLEVTLFHDVLLWCIGTHAPHLDTLTFTLGDGEREDAEWVLEHPTLRRLVVYPHAEWRGPLSAIDTELCPMLKEVQFLHVQWNTCGEQFCGGTAVWVAIELAAKGIAVLDADGKCFGGLSVAGVQDEANSSRTSSQPIKQDT